MALSRAKFFSISLKYKLALPVSIFVFLILVLLTHTTIRLVRDFVVETFQVRLLSRAETFIEAVMPQFLDRNFTPVKWRLEQLASEPEIYGARIKDREGATLFQSPVFRNLPLVTEHFLGVKPLFPRESLAAIILRLDSKADRELTPPFPKLYLAAVPIKVGDQEVARIEIFSTTQMINETIREIYRTRILFSFLAASGIVFLTAAVTWLAIRPLFRLTHVVHDILRGNMEARAKIRSGDEIEELAEAFNEMVGRLEQSLKNLRVRSEALEESEERYRVLVENAPDVIWLLSPEGKIVFMNQGFSGLTREALLEGGLPLLLSFYNKESIQKFEAALHQLKENKMPIFHLTAVYHDPKAKSEVFYSTNLTPVLTQGGGLKAIQAVSRDVTELKRIELMKEHLIRDVTHELKTPVAKFQMTLSWFEKELQKEFEEGRYRDVVDLMKRNADLLMKMITEVMDLSRLEAGTERLVGKPCDFTQILTRVSEDLEPLVRQKNLVLERKWLATPLPFEGDETMLYRLFSNLVINGMKFTSQGKIEVALEKKEGRIRASVKDTGMGLEKEDLGRVFDRFFQKTPATPGMGLGLALAREITVLHGGQIWAESEGLGKGSTFLVEFPA